MNHKHHFKTKIDFWTGMLREAMLVEGKHWPEDYIKVALTQIRDSKYGKSLRYDEDKVKRDLEVIAQRFKAKLHSNQSLGYFNTVARWYAENALTANNDLFIEPKNEDGSQPYDLLEACLETLKAFLDYPMLVQKHGEEVKKELFPYQVAELVDKAKLEDQAKQSFSKIKPTGRKHQVIPFMSYEELNSKFGGDKTGYRGDSEWCHTNGKSTYNSWTNGFSQFFFVIAEDGWESIEPHDNPQKTDNAYDEYGLSLMAILVSSEGELLKCTLRWNHVVEPKYTLPGRAVDNAFTSYAELSRVTGLDVEAEVKSELAKIIEKVNKIPNGKKMYEGPEGICFVIDHLYWYDKDYNPIDPPDEIHGGLNFQGVEAKLKSLEGSPRIVNGDFDCSYSSIESLEGGPQVVTESFNCSLTEIESLEGAPRIVGDTFDCSNTGITSLEGGPESVKDFDCSFTYIHSLVGCPSVIRGTLNCIKTQITSLEGCPKSGTASIFCNDCPGLTSLEGAPREVSKEFSCSSTSITSLRGCPEVVGRSFACDDTKITSLEGAPKSVGMYFVCTKTNLKSLKGAPAHLGISPKPPAFPRSITQQQLDDYRKWLKTNPTENYPG